MTSDQTISVKVEPPMRLQADGVLEASFYAYPIIMTLPGVGRDLRFDRRYGEFDALRSQLCATYWYCVVPPLPEKEGLQGRLDRLKPSAAAQQHAREAETDLLEYRRTALRRFLLRVAYHPLLGKSALLAQFVRDEEWKQCMREPVKLPDFLSTSLADTVLSKLGAVSGGGAGAGGAGSDALTPGGAYRTAVSGGTGEGVLTAPVLDATSEYVTNLETSMRTLRDRFHSLVTRRRAAADAFEGFTEAFGELGEGEEDATLSRAILTVREHGRAAARTGRQQAADEAAKVVSTLGFYVGMCAAVLQTLRYMRAGVGHADQLDRRARELRDSLQRAPQANRQELQNKLESLTQRGQLISRQLGEAQGTFRAELVRFHKDKQFDMRELLKVFGEMELGYAAEMKREWEELRAAIESLSLGGARCGGGD